MSKKPGLRWKIYFFFFMLIAIGQAVSASSQESALYIYYHVLIAFSRGYAWTYYLNLASSLLNLIAVIPLFLFSFRYRFLSPKFWKIFLLFRIIFDASGHRYEFQIIKSNFYQDFWLGISIIFLSLLFIVPSYIACFIYAFRQKRIFTENGIDPASHQG